MPPFYPGTPPTRQLSWQQLVRDSDPNFTRLSLQPWVFDFSNGRLFVDWNPVYDFSFISAGLGDNNDGSGPGVLYFIPPLPIGVATDNGGAPGSVWSNGGECTLVGGFTPQPPAALPLMFGQINATQMVTFNGINLPIISPLPGSGIFWNPGAGEGGPIFIA